MQKLGNVFKTIDAYPKTLEDFTIRTFSGAIGIHLVLKIRISLCIFICLPSYKFSLIHFNSLYRLPISKVFFN